MARPGGKVMFATTAAARQMFLFGSGDGVRVVNLKKLAELSGVSRETLTTYIPAWEAEFEKMLLGSTGPGLELKLREETLNASMQVLTCIENQMLQCRWELEKFDEITAQLESICNNFSINSDNGDAALRLFENYLASRGAKADLRRQIIAMHKHHADYAGISDLRDIQTAAAKALETGRAKLRLKAEGADEVRDVTPAAGAANMLRD